MLQYLEVTHFISLDFSDTLNGTAVGSIGKIVKTTDGGISWFNQTSNSMNNLNSVKFLNDRSGIIAGLDGVILYTTDFGQNWQTQTGNTGNTLNSVWLIDNNKALIVGSFGTIIKTLNLGLVNIQNNTQIINEYYTLSQNYPNPFNPTTKINYSLKSLGNIEIKLFNAAWRYIETLVSKKQYLGNYSVSINGNNLSSGIYFYTLYVNNTLIDSKKCILIK